jgi:HD-GYP domain-containing protein (c-di-GMP phosphodiesterase class II)
MEAKQAGVTCSIGLASYPSDGVLLDELVTAADTALYHAKETGGNRIYRASQILSEPVGKAGANARHTSLSVVYALAAAVDTRNPYIYGHSRKVNAYAVALAEALSLPPETVSRISTAALLHDVGKIGIPDELLNKNGELSDADWYQIKLHPRLGANIVGNVPSLVPCLSGILYHHERWDGNGYPERLKGESIPLEARILAIADAFDAMTSARPYHPIFSREEALEELKRGAGTQFDPKLVEAFINIIKAGLPASVT